MLKEAFQKLSAFFLNYLEYLLLCVVVLLTVFLFYKSYYSYIFFGIFAILGILLYIGLKRVNSGDASFQPELMKTGEKSRRYRTITSTIFFIFFSLSILSLLVSIYSKTFWYYFFVSICSGSIALEIFFIESERQGFFNLFKSFLLVLNITLSNQIVFPNGIALPDISYHVTILYPIVNSGHIPEIGGYEFFPIHHILAGISSILLAFDPRMIYIYLGGFLISAGIIFVYLIGKKFVSLHFGLVSALLYSCLDYFIMYGSHPEHQAYNYFFSLIFFLIIFYVIKYRRHEFLILYIILAIALVYVHHFSSLLLLLLLVPIIGIEGYYNKKINQSLKFKVGLLSVLGLILVFQWTFYSTRLSSLISVINSYSSVIQLGTKSFVPPMAYDQLPFIIIFLNTVGSSLLILISIIGFISLFKKRSLFNYIILTLSIVISILLGLGVILKQSELLPDRMYPFLQVFCLVFLGCAGLFLIFQKINFFSRKFAILFIVSFFILISFFSLSSTISGFETSIFRGNIAYTKIFSTSNEVSSGSWAVSFIPKNINYLANFPISDSGTLDESQISSKTIFSFDKFYLLTGYAKGIGGHVGQLRFIRTSEQKLNLQRFTNIYSNEMVKFYWVD